MRFELSIALKYLIPRWRQLSVSIISLVSILVISLVVWLSIVFLSVTDGIEKNWVDELVSLNAPVRVTPTENYYRSYYYLIDEISADANYTTKTIGEKLQAEGDPYDPEFDAEMPVDFPLPMLTAEGSLKDLVKETWEAIASLEDAQPEEFEVSFSNLRLNLAREEPSFLTQVSYVSSFDPENPRLEKLLRKPSSADLNHLYKLVGDELFETVDIQTLKTPTKGCLLPVSLYPKSGELTALGLMRGGSIHKVILAENSRSLNRMAEVYRTHGQEIREGTLSFKDGVATFEGEQPLVYLPGDLELPATAQGDLFHVQTTLQGVTFAGDVPLFPLEIGKEAACGNLCKEGVPSHPLLGDGILVAKNYEQNGVLLGDQGYLSYYSQGASGMQEQRLPIYVAGFYDPGLMPVGSKVIFVDPSVTAMLRGNVAVADPMLGNGINVWMKDLGKADAVKAELQAVLAARGLSDYWLVQSFTDFEFSRPLLQQLKSDKNLFTLIAVIILLVACSNIISMLILLVNDKRREIGILQSMGASARSIALIFGICGCFTGLISSLLGTLAAMYTLRHLQSLVDFLSFLQGHDAFQAAFFGSSLPNELSMGALTFVLTATVLISLIAGIVPAIKAARIQPVEILRAD